MNRWMVRAYRRPAVRHFALHAFEMFLSMVAGMMLLDVVWSWLWPSLGDRPDADVLVMALNMTIGMGLWMWIRGHGWRMIVEMGGAMVAPFVVLLVPFYLGLLSGSGLMDIGHLAMMLAMLAVMLLRVGHYARPQGWRFRRRAGSRVRDTDSAPEPAAQSPES
jgi:hypothetical protein